jgi:hypothetical protein
MFDLTREIKISDPYHKTYKIMRMILYVLFLLGAFFVLFRILFPIIVLDFSMNTPNSTKNTLVSPRLTKSDKFPEKRMVPSGEPFVLNANPIGQFSNAIIQFTLDKKEKSIENVPVKIQKSYQAFFFPTGNPIGFKNGSLLSTADGSYYIVSDGMLRKFINTVVILQLGYPKESFLTVNPDSLKYNETGSDITEANTYPNDTIFVINETFYQLENQKLYPFISSRAFLSQFDSSVAIAKSNDFFNTYPVADTSIGFADGTLVSTADSIFIISEGKSYPIESSETFLEMGYDFKNVIPITQDELSAHQKQKQFTHDNPHPNGTLFFDQDTREYYIIENRTKRPLAFNSAVSAYTKQAPVLVNSKTANSETSCTLKNTFLSSRVFECTASLQDLNGFIGNDYQISTAFQSNTKIQNISTTFSTNLQFKNLNSTLSKIKTRIINR